MTVRGSGGALTAPPVGSGEVSCLSLGGGGGGGGGANETHKRCLSVGISYPLSTDYYKVGHCRTHSGDKTYGDYNYSPLPPAPKKQMARV